MLFLRNFHKLSYNRVLYYFFLPILFPRAVRKDKKVLQHAVALKLKAKYFLKKLSLGEYGRQRTSSKFHDLVLSLRSQNYRVLEMIMFQALFSRRKVFGIS